MEISRQIGYKLGIARALNNIGLIYNNRSEFEEDLPYVLEAYKISESLHSPSEQIQNNLTLIKNALGEEKYQNLVSEANLQ